MDKLTSIFLAILLCGSAVGTRPQPRTTGRATLADDGGVCSAIVGVQNYPCHEHNVTTKDGYILSLQNIPFGESGNAGTGPRPPVLLHHGVLTDAVTWVLSPPEQSLALVLADNGFDVWLVNARGTKYSLGHTSLTSNDPAFWDWSWDELAAYDLPATFQYIYDQTSQKLHYVGHSMGTLIALAGFSKGQLVNKLRSAALLCPIAYIGHMTSPIATNVAQTLLNQTSHWLKIPEFNPTEEAVLELLLQICKQKHINCVDLLTSYTGQNCCVNSSMISSFLKHEPQSTSTKNMIHFAQRPKLQFCAINHQGKFYLGPGSAEPEPIIWQLQYTCPVIGVQFTESDQSHMARDGTIKMYDYGDVKENVKHYGMPVPPSYNMTNIPNDVPLFLAYGGKDALSVQEDVKLLLDSLHDHEQDKLVVQYTENYAHADFIMGFNARQVVYDPLMAFLRLH